MTTEPGRETYKHERDTTLLRLWHSFSFEVIKATTSLMYLLKGMDLMRDHVMPQYNQIPESSRQSVHIPVDLTGVDVSPVLLGSDLDDQLKHEGDADQVAFKGWVVQVYHIWEAHFRNALSNTFEGDNIIRLQVEAMGDLRLIRNDLIHHNGVATKGNAGKCEILKWFEPSEPIILGIHHVFDFLNQMGLMRSTPKVFQDGQDFKGHYWSLRTDRHEIVEQEAVPKLISLRTSIDNDSEDGSPRYMVSVAFQNGVFGNGAVDILAGDFTEQGKREFFNKAEVDTDGNLSVPNIGAIQASTLYDRCINYLSGERSNEGGIWGPPMKFSK